MPEDNAQSPPPFTAEGQPSLMQLVDYAIERLYDPDNLKRLGATHATAAATGITVAENAAVAVAKDVVEKYGVPLVHVMVQALLKTLEVVEPVTTDVAKLALDAVLGEGTKRTAIPDGVGQKILAKLAPAGGVVEPGTVGAERYLDVITGLNMETWLLGFVSEMVGDAIDFVNVGGATFKSVAELREVITQVFGGSRITRRVLAPFIDDSIVTPAKWATALRYRPTLLSLSSAIEPYLRGDWTREQFDEELGRQGYSAERLSTLVENARKRLSIDELIFRHFRGEISDAETAQLARALGYEEATTAGKIAIEDAKRIDTLNAPVVTEAIANYVAGDIDGAALEQWVNGAAPNATDADRMISTAKARRQINVRHVTSARLRGLVLEGIANVEDYRRALERENYPIDEITMEELSLRAELVKRKQPARRDASLAQLEAAVLDGALSFDDVRSQPSFKLLTPEAQAIELALLQAKVEKRDDDAAAKQAAADEKAAREAEIAAKRARAFPALTEYRKAYVRGYLARAAYAAALTREKAVDDDAAFLLAGADAEREEYLADQAKRAAAAADHDHKGLSIAQLEQATLAGIITIQDFDSDLAKNKVPDDDRRILVKLMQAKLEDQAAAKKKRDAAEQLAALKQVSLSDWERAVRLGVRTTAQYATFLQRLGLDEPSRALILDVIGAQLAADWAAKAKRDAGDKQADVKGLPLAQRRRLVIAGVRPKEFYADAIRLAGWSVDDQLADLDLLDVEIAAAQAARDKRDQVVEDVRPSIVTVSQLEHALVLGLITTEEFRAALIDRGASDDDADLLVQIAVAKVPDARAVEQLHDQVAKELAAKGVSLADLEAAVRRGIVTLDEYARDLSNRGYGGDAVDLMRQLLEEKVGVDVDGLRAKIDAAISKSGNAPPLDVLDAGLDDEAIAPSELQAELETYGAPRDAALVYVRLRAGAREA